jgi:hypothetical protein
VSQDVGVHLLVVHGALHLSPRRRRLDSASALPMPFQQQGIWVLCPKTLLERTFATFSSYFPFLGTSEEILLAISQFRCIRLPP